LPPQNDERAAFHQPPRNVFGGQVLRPPVIEQHIADHPSPQFAPGPHAVA
jgi:hypothetical protein